jgi:hypothetical protein
MKLALLWQKMSGRGNRRRRPIERRASALKSATAGVECLESRTLFSVPALGVNIRRLGLGAGDQLFADAMKATGAWSTDLAMPSQKEPAPIDANGWPMSDAGIEVIQGTISDTADYGGTYALSFTGKATVSPVATQPFVQVANAVYNSAANTTTAQVIVAPGSHDLMLDFTNTRRLPTDATATGITNVQLMRPSGVDSSTPYSSSTVFSTPILKLLSNFSALRFMDYSLTNFNPQVNWSDRTLPSQEQVNGKGGAWEYVVALGNATNEDIWLNIPEMATDAYIAKLAQLIDYGSDGVNPYTGPIGSTVSAANPNPVPSTGPVWAGLKPNLHVYLEYSNEVWNTVFSQAQQNATAAAAEVAAGNSPLNFDGDTLASDWDIRRTAERTVQTSDIFRGVFGDAAMMSEIRPVYEWQYNNLNNTAAIALEFINNYYNNGDGIQHVADPHPVNYFLWGGGGGWYGKLSNVNGTGDVTVANASFAAPVVSGFKPDPSGATWAFSGTAGIAANGSSLGNPASTSGTQAAFIQGSGSFSETVNFTGGLADLAFSAATTGTEALKVSIDGKDASFTLPSANPAWTFTSTYGTTYRTAVFNSGISPGPHTVTFSGVAGTGNLFISNIVAETVNGMYNSTIQDISSTTQSESNWATAFGLKMTGYEGGFTFGSGYTGTDLQIAANLDPRAKQADIAQMDEFYASGGTLAMYYQTTNYIAALTLDINNQNTSKIAAVQSVEAAPQPAVNYGGLLPATAGQSVTVANSLGKNQGAGGLYPLRLTAPGTYKIALNGTVTGGQTLQYILDGQTLSGTSFTLATPGLHALLLIAHGTGSISPSSPAGSVTITAQPAVGAAASMTTLQASSASVAQGTSVTFTATVSPATSGATPTGSVIFYDGTLALSGSIPLSAGVAMFATSSLAAAMHSITATYFPAAVYATSTSPAITETITSTPATMTTTSVMSSSPTAVVGDPITFTATVSPIGAAIIPTGTLTFYDGASPLGAPVILSGGVAMFTTSALSAGSHDIAAQYTPDGNFSASTSSTATQTIDQAATTTSLTSSSNPGALGEALTFTATIAGGAGPAPTGTVLFFNGAIQLGSAVPVSGGIAALTISSLAGGPQTITADYSGDSNYVDSSSAPFSQNVIAPTLSGSLTGPPVSTVIATTPLKLRERLTFTASNGPAAGAGSAALLLSPDESAANSVFTLASMHSNFRLKDGKARIFNLRLPRTLPSTVPAGAYHVLIQTTDTAGHVFTVDSGQTINVVAPVVDLTGSLIVPASVKSGRRTLFTLLVTNTSAANVAASGLLPFNLDTSPDGLLSDATPLLTGKRRIHLPPGKSIRIAVVGTLHSSAFLVATLDPGNAAFPNDVNPGNNTFATSEAITVG